MKRLFVIFSLIFTSIVAFAQINTTTKQKLAVYLIGDVEDSYKKVIGSKMVSEIAKSPDYIAIERTAEFLAAISDEQDYQTSGNVTDSQIARLGQQFGVRYVAVVDANELLDQIFVSSRLIDVQSGVIVYTYDTSSPVQDMTQLMNLSQDVAKGLIINPKEEERERLAAEQERIEQERQRKIEEARKAEQQKQEEADRKKRERAQALRNQAIKNLIGRLGVNAVATANFIIIDNLYPAEFEYNSTNRKPELCNNPPQGWNVADSHVVSEYISNYRYKLNNLDYIIPSNYTPYPYPLREFNTSKNLGPWHIKFLCNRPNPGINSIWLGSTEKHKGSVTFVKISNKAFCLYYRPMFTEYEIQQEINRIQ